jgi:predicted methyltransferase
MTARTLDLTRPLAATVLPFALPIGLSAFLLFSVQPLVGRLVLPIFGGAPAVWATMLCFFQAILLVGYLYGHLSVTRFGTAGPLIHLGLAALGVVALVASPTDIAGLRDEAAAPVLDLIRILALVIGLPALVLTTTTPLVSGWFEAARARHEVDPYWLYALSNGGSLLALLAYPLVIEPRLGLADQRGLWAVGYGLLVVLLAVAAVRVAPLLRARSSVAVVATAVPAATASETEGVTWARRGRWLLLAAVPSGLLSAVTTFVATDLVSAPLLWVLPLAIYLISFIIAFSPRGATPIRLATIAAPAMCTLLWVPYGSAGGWPVAAIVVMEFAAFGVLATALHGLLAADRPHPARLTEFYLVLSAGGALASAFVALLAPVIFPSVWEYPILIVAGLVALALVVPVPARTPRPPGRRGLDFSPFVAGVRGRFGPYLVAAALLSVALLTTGALAAEAAIRWLLVGGLILLVGARPWFLAIATAFVLALATFVLQPPVDFRARSFFGVTEVLPSPDGELTLLMHGTTVHGSQSTDPAERGDPQAYYVTAGPLGDVFRASAATTEGRTSAVGVIGLGGGAAAAYIDPAMTMTFFEIDPVVIRVASDPRYFTFLADAPTEPVIVEGDARLSLVDVPDDAYDLLVMDAFSSDSPPVHLLTSEAIADQLRVTRDDGVIAFHVSNRYYDLAPPIAAAVTASGWTILEKSHAPGEVREPGETPSRWLAASADPDTIASLRAAGWGDTAIADRPFTDDYADLLRYLLLFD